MAIPVELQNFKAAGIYRLLYDKSAIANVDASVLRLIVGYSDKGPFNTPVYIAGGDTASFKTLFGDISKKQEKRGIYFHKLAQQALSNGPILALNLKKFDGETVDASTISTAFNTKSEDAIDGLKLRVEDIYDTTRFWKLDSDKLNNLKSVEGQRMNEFVNITETDAHNASVTYFIRKASPSQIAQYNVNVSDWYGSDEEIPEYLERYKQNLISDFFAEIYVFKGKFTEQQVLTSTTLKNYFTMSLDADGNKILQLRPYTSNGYGDIQDTLEQLYGDSSSNAVGHWVGALIPQFKTKQGSYAALDILFNQDSDIHGLMMSFNEDMLYEDATVNIDLSGRTRIPSVAALLDDKNKTLINDSLSIDKMFAGTATSTLLGNQHAPVIADKIGFGINIGEFNGTTFVANTQFFGDSSHVYGTLYVSGVDTTVGTNHHKITLQQVGDVDKQVVITTPVYTITDKDPFDALGTEPSKYIKVDADGNFVKDEHGYIITAALDTANIFDANGAFISTNLLNNYVLTNTTIVLDANGQVVRDVNGNIILTISNTDTLTYLTAIYNAKRDVINNDIVLKTKVEVVTVAELLGVTFTKTYDEINKLATAVPVDYAGTYFNGVDAFALANKLNGPKRIITAISRLEAAGSLNYTDADENMNPSFMDVVIETNATQINTGVESVYGSSVSFIDLGAWHKANGVSYTIDGASYTRNILVSDRIYDDSLLYVLQNSDCLLGNDDTTSLYFGNSYVSSYGTQYKADGSFDFHYIILSSDVFTYTPTGDVAHTYIVRVDASLNKEIGKMTARYLEGYTYKNDAPNGTGMWAKLQWQHFILSALTEYKGLRTGLLNKSEIDYRYIVDTFESFPEPGLKTILSSLALEKKNVLCISNFPSVNSFVKCPYTSFTDAQGIFDVKYVVAGSNKRKSASISFSLPAETDGAAYITFYTPLKFSDGYIDTIVPSAGLVSNLFVNKYSSRQPYYIIAGPNYGAINATNLVGPDYNYSSSELQVIEPFGVNAMIYRTKFGTFINANQTAKQTPKSALSLVNIAELCIYLQDQIEDVLQSYQWEFNNQVTRNAIKDKADTICSNIQANGGIQTYLNVMDKTNNTDDIINNEMGVISTYIEPGYGMGKMVQELTVYSTGRLSANIKQA